MKKYNVKIQRLTGSWYYDGSLEIGNEIEVHSNSLYYVNKKKLSWGHKIILKICTGKKDRFFVCDNG